MTLGTVLLVVLVLLLLGAIPSWPHSRFADSSAPRRAGLAVNGAQVPLCRHASLTAALAVAATGDTVKATGFVVAPVVFTEEAITVPAGVRLTTADEPLGTTSYVIEPAAAVGAAPFVTLRPGATLSGFGVRNTTASGAGVGTSCAGAGDVALVTVDTVTISGLGTGTPQFRFSNGLRHAGNCSLVLKGSTVEDANDTGVLITGVAAETSLTMTGNLIQRNQANVTQYAIGPAPDRTCGGLVFIGTVPGTVVFSANSLLSNAGDQVLVFSAGTLNLSTPLCDDNSNTIACYSSSGVGLSSKAGTVNMAHTVWWNPIPAEGVDYVVAPGAVVSDATNLACTPNYTGPCP